MGVLDLGFGFSVWVGVWVQVCVSGLRFGFRVEFGILRRSFRGFVVWVWRLGSMMQES